jgi:short-subunit dehydrogenase
MNPRDARVLLTGASGGIGQATASRLVQAGAAVLLSGRSAARLAAQARELRARHDAPASRVEWHVADLSDAAAVQRLVEACQAWACNVVIHGAGSPAFGPLDALAPEQVAQTLHANLLAPMLLTQSLLPHLRRQPLAQVMCIGSVLGRIGLPGYSAYSASKFGLRGFAEALRRELRRTSVRVQYLGPRSTRTAFNDAAVEDYNRRTGTAMDPVELVAAAVLRMLQDEAAERFLGFPEALAVRLNGFAPALLDGAFDKHCSAASAAAAAPPCTGHPCAAALSRS